MDLDLCYSLAQGHHELGAAPFVIFTWLWCGFCSHLCLGSMLLEPSEVSACLSVHLGLGIFPMLSLMESGWPERKQCLEGAP